MPQTDIDGALQLGEDLRRQVAEGFAGDSGAGRGDDQRRDHDVRRRARGRRRGGPGRRRPGDVPGQGGGAQPGRSLRGRRTRARSRAQRSQTTSARIRDALTQNRLSLATQPIRSLASGGIERYELLLRMTGDERRAAAGRLLHRDRRALRDGPGARPLGGRPGAGAAGRARARRRPGLPPHQPLGRLADRHLGARVHRAPPRRRRRRPRPLHLRDHPDRPGRGLRDGRRLRRPPDRVRLRSRDRRLRRRLRPLRLPEARSPST